MIRNIDLCVDFSYRETAMVLILMKDIAEGVNEIRSEINEISDLQDQKYKLELLQNMLSDVYGGIREGIEKFNPNIYLTSFCECLKLKRSHEFCLKRFS